MPKYGSEPIDQVTCRLGDRSCARAHASALQRSTNFELRRKKEAVLNLQRNYGNRFTGQVLHSAAVQMKGDSEEVAPDVEAAIERTRGGGQPLDGTVQSQMGKAFNADFSAVRVHTSSEAGALNQSLSARAFTTGKDIYFRQGEYNPGTSAGRELLAHELTHVVQQNGEEIQTKTDSPVSLSGKLDRKPILRKLSVGRPGDIYEQEADRLAAAVSRQEQTPAPTNEEEKEKEMVATKPQVDQLSRQLPEEEEEMQAKRQDQALQRQPEEEEELQDQALQRQEETEEEETI